MSRLSVIVPIYNAERFLKKCIESILDQSFTDFELLLINDGSKDGCGDICLEYVGKDSRIRYIYQENGGASSAKNNGLRNSRGEYCAFVDSDDLIDSDYFLNMFRGIEEYNADLCVGNIAFENYETHSTRKNPLHSGFFSIKEYLKFYPEYMPRAIIGSACNKIFSVRILKEIGLYFDEYLKNNEDTQFNYQYLLYIPRPLIRSSA